MGLINMTFLKKLLLASVLPTVALASFAAPSFAQDEEKDEEEKSKTIEDFTEEFEQIEGLFPLYRDPEAGALYMEVSADQLGDEFIAYTYTENGVVQAGHFRGNYRDQRVVSFDHEFGKLYVTEENTSFYFDPENALSRAAEANISPAVLAALEVKAETEGEDDAPTRYLVSADSLFLNESLHQVKPSSNPEAKPTDFSLGSLSSDKTRYAGIKNYPENTDIIVDYVYDKDAPLNGGGAAVTDARAVTIKVQHTLLEMPENDFEPRLDDYRVGYFLDRVTDLTDPSATPYRDLVNRWNLVKKDPDAELSEPVTPITWWIENTTPEEHRDTIRDAVLAWNSSFEQAGFKNAIEVKVQPDDADWDAGDIRYNVLRWTSSPQPPFGGYGPSFTNPRTGEILAADIMLEYVFLTNRMTFETVFPEALANAHKGHNCDFGLRLQQDLMFAKNAMPTGVAQGDLVDQGIYYLLLHEVGHTLGLNHNMKASQLHGPREVHDKNVTQGIIAGSVMDYPALNVAPLGMPQGDYANSKPGPYDDWAIIFGYDPDISDPAARKALLDRSTDPALTFGNDADDMRRAGGGGIDPRVMIGDMSSDMVTYGSDRVELVRELISTLPERFNADGDSAQAMRDAWFILTAQQRNMASSVSRFVGGIYVERAANGQPGKTQAFTPVSLAEQKRAMDMLSEYLFAADAFEVSPELAANLQAQRRGFDFFGNPEDPKIHARALSIQQGVLDHLLSSNVLNRMTDYQVYGGEYAPAEMLLDLNEAVIGGDLTGNPNTFRQNLQVAYVTQLAGILEGEGYHPVAKTAAFAALQDVQSRVGLFAFGQSTTAKAHRAHIANMVEMAIGG
jgi:hypothetical protein